MAHEIEGNSAFFASNKPAWHGLGTVLKDAPSVGEAWRLAYPHELMKLDLSASIPTGEGLAYMPIESHKAVFRSDGKHIGTVGADYELEQPYDVMAFFEPFLESGMLELEAGGSLRDGSRMWALAKLKGGESQVATGDVVKSFLLAATGFDGSMARIIKWCSERVVCANTLAIALGENTTEWKIRHTKGLTARVANVQEVIGGALRDHAEATEQYRLLASRQWSRTKMETYVRRVVVGIETAETKVSAAMESKVQTVTELLDTQRGLELVPAIRGTAWQAYNAVTDYITHHAGRNADNRLNNQWFGVTAQDNRQALELALTF